MLFSAADIDVFSKSLPPVREALSGIFGGISITAWVFLGIPQLFKNYKSQSADGLSLAFLGVWLFGDLTNAGGALFTELAPSALILAAYFCLSDLVLISQTLYYNTINSMQRRHARRRHPSVASEASEEEPLLQRRRSSSAGLPGSHRRHVRRQSESNLEPITRMVTGEDETPDSNPWLHNTLSVLGIYVLGTLGYFALHFLGSRETGSHAAEERGEEPKEVYVAGIVLGYTSAVCYLCARLPQIYKNYKEQSTEGLSLLFFLLSLTGNMTYGLSLLTYRQDADYLLNALPWLLGSLGTIVEDCIIFLQFRMYAKRADEAKPDEESDGTANGTVNGSAQT